jgi:hypothetical protein
VLGAYSGYVSHISTTMEKVRRLMYGENKPNTQEVVLAHFGKFFAQHVWLNFASECFGLEQTPIRTLWRDYYSYLNHQFGEIMF